MADTTDHGPGQHPDAVKTNEEGLPVTDGRPGWIWMEDPTTGGRFDVHSKRAAWQVARGARVVEGYPVNYGRSARPPKSAVGKDGGPPAPPSADADVPGPVPASALGAVEPADDRQPDDPATDPDGETGGDDQAADGGKPTSRKAGRTR